MKTVTINKIKVRIFEEKELREKLNMKEEDIEIVLEYQRTFPELLQEGVDGFVIDGDILWNKLGKPHGEYGKWFKRKISESFIENIDFSRYDKIVGTINNGNGKLVERHMFTIETAKTIGFMTGTDKRSDERIRNNANMLRKYFMIMESTLRNYEEWNKVREPEKQNANILKSKIGEYASRNLDCYDLGGLCSREFNLINKSLTGYTALEIKLKLGYLDKMTREHLNIEYNKAISYLQLFDINLLQCNIDFENRSKMINNICELNYKHLKEEFNK